MLFCFECGDQGVSFELFSDQSISATRENDGERKIEAKPFDP